jgi:NADH:ubiquinone oxidoreductase subunit E
VGACGLAPVVTADEETFGQVKPNHIPEILNAFS